ncbi:protein-L-isoaspartate(D-aspartate) O-methyltransferase [Catalinimonas niigatensis]|uniref:protein-L-isoaspartate(D-aspartate) O-methyltransferase n=1 Tax=Catalinimonas niigatensis TaxID=1397264 RepID=UPI002666D265|nr:protein-L-isoaspartate(D-aspartate) O-methyltransferase [Catalinimonas niigatensis]WPP52586.1 protein-L-isoaspartate(D-aspartate) O-methyltransferase [Catalinimonas niigatensis]
MPIEDNYKHRGMRRQLVNKVRSKGITDERVLRAINTVPRHAFLDNAFLTHAYQDKAFQIGEGQTISQPYTVAFQTQLLQIKPGDKVLEIGTGSGYQCSILAEMGANVYSIEYHWPLHQRAGNMLKNLGYQAHLFHGDGTKGLPAFAPYDGIIVTAGAPSVPMTLIAQLAPGGRLVIPVGDRRSQKMLLIMKDESGKMNKKEFDHFSFVPLLGQHGWENQ